MANLSLEQRLELACNYLEMMFKLNAPKDTWNLTYNGIRLVQIEPNTWKIVIGGETAPYAIFTNEKWTRGKNPNEGWIERTIEQSRGIIEQIMGGTLSIEDIAKATSSVEQELSEMAKERAVEIMEG